MAPIGTIQLAGNANAGPAEVELNTLATRSVVYPNDFYINAGGQVNGYGINLLVSNASTAPPTTPTGWGMLSNSGASIVLVRRVIMSLELTVAGTGSGGAYSFQLVRGEGVQGPSNIHHSSFRTSFPGASQIALQQPNVAGSGANSPSTAITLPDAQALAAFTQSMPLVSGSVIQQVLWDSDLSQQPLLLYPDEVVGLQMTQFPAWTAATTLQLCMSWLWQEFPINELGVL